MNDHLNAEDEAPYHTRFSPSPEAVNAVDSILPALWESDRDVALSLMDNLAGQLADVYDVPTPGVEYGPFPRYVPLDGRVYVDKPSVVSFLHEFRHHLQAHGHQRHSNSEEDARGWSVSVFAAAAPDDFDQAWRDGTIMFMPPHPDSE